mgnify:CR=1 FL=1
MPMTIRIETETGGAVKEAADVHNVITGLVGAADGPPLLLAKYIDPYADTVFNSLQIPDLLSDLRALAQCAKSEAQRSKLLEVMELARSCDSDPHLYLKFYGD